MGSVRSMNEPAELIEILMRGGAAGVSFLLAIALGLYGRKSRTSVLGALFCLSTGIYVVISSPLISVADTVLAAPVAVLAIWGTVFFWWFGASLFDDSFRWRWWRFAPMGLLPLFFLARYFGVVSGGAATALLYLHLAVNALLFADVLRLAITHAADDLVNPRRRFRIVISVVVAVFGIGIAVAEIAETRSAIPTALVTFQGVAIFALNLVFGAWLLTPRGGLFAQERIAPSPASPLPESYAAVDRPVLEKLTALMEAKAYRTEGLSVAVLAEQVGVPEHQLRKLINGALGYRNFSSFLNSYRIKDAKAALADPENARRQILQIALDLGYGSIAPFNRAFKQATGKTPTEFRKEKLGDALIDTEKS